MEVGIRARRPTRVSAIPEFRTHRDHGNEVPGTHTCFARLGQDRLLSRTPRKIGSMTLSFATPSGRVSCAYEKKAEASPTPSTSRRGFPWRFPSRVRRPRFR
jgi:hypothetical protein